jgi:hypothetical protein
MGKCQDLGESETNSYVVFLRMGSLAALLLRQYIEQHKTKHTTQPMEKDLPIQKINHLPIPVSLIVSSSYWHFSFTEDEGLNSAHVSEIVWRLMRIACLPAELLEENECSLDKEVASLVRLPAHRMWAHYDNKEAAACLPYF